MKQLIYILSLAVLFLACNDDAETKDEAKDKAAASGQPVAADTMRTADGHDAKNSLDWAGTYKGVLPCADCEGIETEIMLHADHTFMLGQKYLGNKDETVHRQDGKWNWLDGSTLELEGMKGRPSRYFVAENRIIQLDREGKRIEGGLAEKYVLTKMK